VSRQERLRSFDQGPLVTVLGSSISGSITAGAPNQGAFKEDRGFIVWLDLSLNKLTDLICDKLSNVWRQRTTASCELMEHFVRRERSIRNKDWSLVGWVNLFSAVHLHVRKASVRRPRQSPLPIRLIIAKLETVNRVVGSIPDNQVKEIIVKPPPIIIAANRLFGRVIEHRTEGLTRQR
jgi:hypothetical protein